MTPRDDASAGAGRRLSPLAAAVGAVGEAGIYAAIRLLGRRFAEPEVGWLAGPTGSDPIGDRPYDEWAAREGLTVERDSRDAGLIPDLAALASPRFAPDRVHPAVRRFYEETARYRMDVWARSFFPASLGLRLLVTTISRRVDQLNFPLTLLDAARGMESEIVLLRDPQGRVRHTGWYRRLGATGRVLYSGFYATAVPPDAGVPCVKVVFPMPGGNATVLLEPRVADGGALELVSRGRGFGDAGFYRLQRAAEGSLRVWYVRSLVERFRLHVDDTGTLRCDHRVRFLGLPVLHLHYRIEPRAADV